MPEERTRAPATMFFNSHLRSASRRHAFAAASEGCAKKGMLGPAGHAYGHHNKLRRTAMSRQLAAYVACPTCLTVNADVSHHPFGSRRRNGT
ncbi:hypothetical protein Emed_004783 [Eimeria media]